MLSGQLGNPTSVEKEVANTLSEAKAECSVKEEAFNERLTLRTDGIQSFGEAI